MSAVIPVSMLSSGGCHKPLSIDHVEFPVRSSRPRSADVDIDFIPPPASPPSAPPPYPPGMSLRDFFAAFALAGCLAADAEGDLRDSEAADYAYTYADAMLRRRALPAQVIH